VLVRSVAAATDDAEQFVSNDYFYTTSSDLEMSYDSDGAGDQRVGLRFTNLTIPRGATITRAYVQFTANAASSSATTVTIRGFAQDSTATFGSSATIAARPVTASQVSWTPTAWLAGAAGAAQQSSDVRAVVQEIVNRAGWAPGNALGVVISGSGSTNLRSAVSFDGCAGNGKQPILHVEYQ
jgi:hypothetical protein